MSSRGIVQAFVCCAVLLTACPGQAAEPSRQSLISAGHERNYALYVPDSAHNAKSPLVLLLHGSYDKGEHMVALWRDVADREGVVLAAPNATHYDGWRPKLDTPHFIAEVINDAARRTPIDMRRLYLFGQSGGADFALLLAMMESRAFAAMAIHAGAWRHPDEFKLMRFAQRRIPLFRQFVGPIECAHPPCFLLHLSYTAEP